MKSQELQNWCHFNTTFYLIPLITLFKKACISEFLSYSILKVSNILEVQRNKFPEY